MAATTSKATIQAALTEARQRTHRLQELIPDHQFQVPAARYLSPPNWDLGHIANFEELWLVQKLAGLPESTPGSNDVYNALMHERQERPKLPLLDRSGVLAYQRSVRAASLEILQNVDLEGPLLEDGFVYWMLVLHEYQHQETLLQTLVMRQNFPATRRATLPATEPKRIVDVPAGTFPMGRNQRAKVYDNEAPPHRVAVDACRVDSTPATLGEYLEFVAAGGYDDPQYWSQEGNRWRHDHPAPLYWYWDSEWRIRDGQGDRSVASDSKRILSNINFYEAEAFARFRGGRLPTEAEWEYVARNGSQQLHPWGDQATTPELANMDQWCWGPGLAGGGPPNQWGVQHLIGDVWEWTQSRFEAYPGTKAFPYPEYSQVFYGGDFRVLRGGSWASRSPICTATFRNWDVPKRQQIFAGVRVWYDAL